MRILTAICVAAIVVAFTVPALAETQNIKVSGDIKVAHVYQNDLDLNDAHTLTDGAAGDANEDDSQNFFIQQVGLNVEADLTDNVSTYVRIINEREWNADDDADQAAAASVADAFDITLDEAYLTLKEMLYAPLTVKIGRQNIWLGRGLMVGNAGVGVWDTQGAMGITIRELSDATAFDAVRATLDYDPWTIDLIYAKINETNALISDDHDLYVANVGYDFTKYDAEAEVYFITDYNQGDAITQTAATVLTDQDENDTYTLGIRGSLVPFDNMNVWSEGALQFGKYSNTNAVNSIEEQVDREAYAFNAGGTYDLVDVKWTPTLGVEYLYLSGEDVDVNNNATGDWGAWNPLFRGRFNNMISDFRNITKMTDYDVQATGVVAGGDGTGNNNGATNQIELAAIASLDPMTDVSIDARYSYLWFAESPLSANEDSIGSELDITLTYDYTEDVQFSLASAIFFAGDYYPSVHTYTTTTTNDTQINADKTAIQVISAVSVDF